MAMASAFESYMLSEKSGDIMLIKITVRSTTSRDKVTNEAECRKETDITNCVAAVLMSFRALYPDNPPFEWKLSVEKAIP